MSLPQAFQPGAVATGAASGIGLAMLRLCVPKTISTLMRGRNRVSWRDDRAAAFRSGHFGLAAQVEEPA